MAQVYPFCGLRYNLKKIQNIQKVLAPPYDIVTDKIRDQFLLSNPYNIFHLELPKKDRINNRNKYENARFFLQKWIDQKVIIKDNTPCIYLYDISFKINNKSYSRKGIVALVRVEPWETRIIRPHEKTFNNVTSDRLALLEHTKTQFSQVFLLYKGNKQANSIINKYNKDKLYEVVDPSGNVHKLSAITNSNCAKELHEFFKQLPMYIADGHHRYTTALTFSQKMKKRFGSELWRAYNYIMVYMVDVDDPGLIVLPTHRIVSLSSKEELFSILRQSSTFFEIVLKNNHIDKEVIKKVKRELANLKSTTAFAVFYKKNNQLYSEIWKLKPSVFKELLSFVPKSLAELDVTILNEIVFSKVINLDLERESDISKISFTPEEADILSIKENQIFFMLNATKAHEVLKVSDEGLVMPHKSTFFYPKILTGLVMNPVSEHDKVLLL